MLNKLEPLHKSIEMMMQLDKKRVEIVCPVCTKAEWEYLDQIRKPIVDSHLCICKNCGFISYNPQLKNIKQWYTTEVRPQDIAFLNTKKIKIENFKKILFKYMLDNNITPTSVLDYGCSDGFILKELKALYPGIQETGIELNPGHKNWAKFMYGLNATSDDNLSNYAKNSFDIIILHHVLEHIQQPDMLLKIFNDMLTDKGLLYIALPTINRIDYNTRFDLFKDEHINVFTNDTLEQFLRVMGFKKVHLNTNLYGTAMVFQKTNNPYNIKNYYDENMALLNKINACFTYKEKIDNAMGTGNMPEARKVCIEALAQFDEYPELIIKYASLHDAIDEQDILKSYIDTKPHMYELLIAIGLSCFKDGDFDNAELYLLKAIEIKGDNMLCLLHLGQIYYHKKDILNAIKYLKKSWEFEPYNQAAFELLAAVLTKI